MKKYTCSLNNDELRALCIRENYFTAGDCEMYRKLFAANDEDASLEELATIIWVCSSNVSRLEILDKLQAEARWPIYPDCIAQQLRDAGFGETEIEIITEAVRTHPDAGIAYQLMQ